MRKRVDCKAGYGDTERTTGQHVPSRDPAEIAQGADAMRRAIQFIETNGPLLHSQVSGRTTIIGASISGTGLITTIELSVRDDQA